MKAKTQKVIYILKYKQSVHRGLINLLHLYNYLKKKKIT